MTHDHFKQAVDTLDTGLPDRPDLVAIRAEGRAVRRRRRSITVAGGLAAAAVLAVPLTTVVLDGSSSGSGDRSTDVAGDTSATPSPVPTPSATPTVDPSAYADQAQRMTATVTEVFPQARRTGNDFYDSMVTLDDGSIDITLSDPPNWGSVFRWNQEFAFDDLQYFNVSASWDSDVAGMSWCSSGSFAEEADCDATRTADGWLLVQHDGVRLRGEGAGDWSRYVQLVSPPSERGLVQQVEVWAQEEDMTWAQADAVLPSLDDLAAIASDARMRLPEPVALPEVE